MNQDFAAVMAKRTTEELIAIVRVNRYEYQPEAVKAAEQELSTREVNPDLAAQVVREIREEHTKKTLMVAGKVPAATRLIHFIVDRIIVLILVISLASIFSDTIISLELKFGSGAGLVLFIPVFFLYFGFMEYNFQKTLAKFFTKSKVVMVDGSKAKFQDILIRTACRLIPLESISFLININGLHDRFSNTTVVKD